MSEYGSSLALDKTLLVVLTKERFFTVLHIQVGEWGSYGIFETSVKYIGKTIDEAFYIVDVIC